MVGSFLTETLLFDAIKVALVKPLTYTKSPQSKAFKKSLDGTDLDHLPLHFLSLVFTHPCTPDLLLPRLLECDNDVLATLLEALCVSMMLKQQKEHLGWADALTEATFMQTALSSDRSQRLHEAV